jgi:HK97 gp10 family phage protein
MAKGVKEIDRGWNKIKAELLDVKNIVVDVGVQAGSRSEDGQDMASIAAYNEFGTEHTPSRPFMRSSFDENVGKIDQFAQNAIEKVVSKRLSTGQAMHLVGLKMTGIIQRKIVAGPWILNAISTVMRKGSDRPLIDTGRLRQSIRHVVRRR